MKNCLFVYTALVRSCMSRTIFDQFLICDLKSLNNRGKVFHRPNSAVQLSLSPFHSMKPCECCIFFATSE